MLLGRSVVIKRSRRRAAGFTIIEFIVAFALTIIAVVTMLSVFASSVQSVQQSGDSMQAQAFAQQALDVIREFYESEGNPPQSFCPTGDTVDVCTAFSLTLTPQTSGTYNGQNPEQFRGVAQQAPTYTLTYTATPFAGSTPEHDIVLTITWTGLSGQHTRTYEEFVRN